MSMVKVKTAELSGAALDWAVAVAEGLPLSEEAIQDDYIMIGTGCGDLEVYVPSTHWMDGGPLIEENILSLHDCAVTGNSPVSSGWMAKSLNCQFQYGKTPLIAACRAIVAAKLGDTVEVPKELMP